MKQFDLEYQYQFYLEKSDLSEEKMHPIQACETRRAFMASATQILILLRDDIPKLSDEEGVKVLINLMDQAEDFWSKEKENECL